MAEESLFEKAITYHSPETIPVSVGIMPSLWKARPKEMKDLASRYPQFFGDLGERYDYEQALPASYHTGSFTDEWGCVWSNVQEGHEAIVTGHPVKTREDIRTLKIPENRTGSLPHGFMYLRLLDLRGFEEAMLDFAEEPPELQTLIDKVLEYNLIQTEIAVKKSGNILYLGDDLGMQTGLAIGREKWIKYLKPCFAAIYKIAHDAGKLVYMHTDGCIWEIMPELHEAGADMINPQYRANGLENLVRVCKGKIPIDLDLDRQLLPFTTPAAVETHIRECVEAFYLKEGGLALRIYVDYEVRLEVIEAAVAALEKYRHYKG